MSGSVGQPKPKIVSAREVMNKNVLKVSPDESVKKAAELMSQRNVGSILVMDEAKLEGIVTERDLVNKVTAKGIDPQNTKVRQVMSTPVVTVNSEVLVTKVMEILTERGIRRVVVIEDEEKVVGVLSQRDIHAWTYQLFRSMA